MVEDSDRNDETTRGRSSTRGWIVGAGLLAAGGGVALATMDDDDPEDAAVSFATEVTPPTQPTAEPPPALPEGYDWRLKLGDTHTLAKTVVTEIRDDERKMTLEYFRQCEKALGPFPLETFDCSEAQDMPVTGAENLQPSITRYTNLPPSVDGIASCERPSLIYRDLGNIGCSSGNRIRRVSEGPSDWIYICRRGSGFFEDEHLYDEIGLIGSNRETGRTCFFAGRAAVTFTLETKDEQGELREGMLGAVLGRTMHAPSGDEGVAHWAVPGEQGCTQCHSHGPWLSFPFVDGTDSYAELKWTTDEYDDPQVETLTVKRYMEDDGHPVVPERHPGMLYDPVYPHEVLTGPSAAKWNVAEWDRAKRLRPQLEGVGLCTTCHHVGNLNYARRYPRSVFYFGDELRLDHDSARDRADLYLGNVSEDYRGSHNTKMLTLAWSQSAIAGIAGYVDTLGEDGRIEPEDGRTELEAVRRDNEYLRHAIETIEGCTNEDSKKEDPKCWVEHWTPSRVEDDPLQYLIDTCSHCHAENNPKMLPLTTQEDFLKGGAAWSRLNSVQAPHPPGGRLPKPILAILAKYLAQ